MNACETEDSQLSGYLELGMIAEAEELAFHYLRDEKVSAATFNEAIDAVLVSDDLMKWRADIETAFCRLTPRECRAVRFKMLSFYWSLRDFGTAAELINVRKCSNSAELLITIEVLLEFDRLDEERLLARRCERKLEEGVTELEAGQICEALGGFYSRMGQPLEALEHWKSVPASSPFLHNALLNTIEICL